MCCTWITGNTGRKKSPSAHHRTTLSGYVFATKAYIDNWKKKLVKQQYLLHMSSQYGELWHTSGWDRFSCLGHPANFNGFQVLVSLLQRRRSPEANQTLHNVWPSPELVHDMVHFRGALAVWWNFARCKIEFTSKSCVLLYWQHYCTVLQQWAWAKLCGMVQGMELPNFCRGHLPYSAGRPSCWASAHILVLWCVTVQFPWSFVKVY